jgi:hypothetical protein
MDYNGRVFYNTSFLGTPAFLPSSSDCNRLDFLLTVRPIIIYISKRYTFVSFMTLLVTLEPGEIPVAAFNWVLEIDLLNRGITSPSI